MAWTLIAGGPTKRPTGASLWYDHEKGTLHFDSWYDGSFQGPELDIAWEELMKRVQIVKEKGS